MEIAEIKLLLEKEIGAQYILSLDENATPVAIVLDASKLSQICELLRDNDQTFFDLLSCVTAIDNGEEANTMELIYNLYSIPLENSLMLKTTISRQDPKIDSVSALWQTANWHEREIFDLFGITFEDHPDLRRILMPADWKGFPMRKDYTEPSSYRGINTVRESDQIS